MIGDNYLHVNMWRPNFREEREETNTLPVWVRFSILPVEYYTERWLKKMRNEIGRTIKVDLMTLLASRGKFARVCVEVDLEKLSVASYRMHGEFWRLRYEGLHELCFGCGKYGHLGASCPLKMDANEGEAKEQDCQNSEEKRQRERTTNMEEAMEGYEDCMVMQRNRHGE